MNSAPAECDHEWVLRDDSFDHEFGTEQVFYWECQFCDATKETEAGDFHDYLDWELG